MKRIKQWYLGMLVVFTALWFWADPILGPIAFFPLRSALMQYTGILAMAAMSVAMILAVRPVVFEPWLGGLDKMYRLHKWLGISALVVAVIHWLWARGPHWLIDLGWMAPRGPRPPRAEQTMPVFKFFQGQRHLAEQIGEWAFYAVVALIVLALLKRFPYRHFFKTHRLLAIAYLALVFHSLVLLNFHYWDHVIGPVMALLMAGGTVASVVVLFRKVAASRQAVGEIETIVQHRDLHVIEVGILLKSRWQGHDAGQFAFVTFDESEGAHPFTISSAWTGDGRIAFIIKELGDYTSTLSASLKTGGLVRIEGPYGRFNFASRQPRQIWVGGGIGITPFVARMKTLARQPDGKVIDLFHTTAVYEDVAIGKLEADARAANVRLHVLVDAKDGRLDAGRICAAVPDWRFASIWFCGPKAFGEALRRDFLARGLSAEDFHQEFFDMR